MNAKAAFLYKFLRNLRCAKSERRNYDIMNAKAAFLYKFL